MKVTRLIREYVERSVTALSKKSQEEIDYGILQDKCADASTYIRERTIALAAELKKEVIEKFDIPEEYLRESAYSLIIAQHNGTPISQKAYAAKERRDKAMQDKISEILLNLELGATRAELDDMIAKLQQESVEN